MFEVFPVALLLALAAPEPESPNDVLPPPSPDTTSAVSSAGPAADARTPPVPPVVPPEGLPERFRVEDEDIAPSVPVVETDEVSVRLGSLLQLHWVPVVGDDALLANGDVASEPGLRLRRARLGVEARLRSQLGLFLTLNPLGSDPEVASVADAKLFWDFRPWLNFTVGTSKVPFSRSALTSSRRLLSVERPLSVALITPERRLGFTVEGVTLQGKVAYLAAVMNGTPGFSEGNQFGGVLSGGRVELSPWGRVEPYDRHRSGVSFGASALYETNSAVDSFAWSADVLLVYRGASLALEALCNRLTPGEAPEVSPDISDSLRRCGAYAEAGYFLPAHLAPVQLVGRVERFDDNTALEDSGDLLLANAGVNVDVVPNHARVQVQYQKRWELHGPERANDAWVVALQGAF